MTIIQFAIALMAMLVFLSLVSLLIGSVIWIDRVSNNNTQQVRYQQQVNNNTREDLRKKKEEIEKAKFAALSEEQQRELLTQYYLQKISAGLRNECSVAESTVSISQNTETAYSYEQEDEKTDTEIANERMKGYFGYEYGDYFEGFQMNEETEAFA